MDFVTHAAVGALVGRGATPRDATPGTGGRLAAAGAMVASLPDADHVLEYLGADAYLLHHRSATHSLLFLALVVVTAALLPGAARGRRVTIAAGAIASHLFLDALTPFGTGLWWPFADARVALDVLPIVAPWMVGLSLAGLALATARTWRAGELAGRRAAWAALGVLLLFLGLEALVAGRAARLIHADEVVALPNPTRPWQAVAFGADADEVREYRVGLDGHPAAAGTTPRLAGDDAGRLREARTALAGASVRPYLARFRLPAARVEGDRLVLEDVQYDHVSHDVEPAWVVVPLGRSGDGPAVAHELSRGVQPVAWGAVVLLAWGAGRRRTWWWRRSPRNDAEKSAV